jgi:hypothetical protein
LDNKDIEVLKRISQRRRVAKKINFIGLNLRI